MQEHTQMHSQPGLLWGGTLLAALVAVFGTACVTPAEFEKVRVKVVKLERAQEASSAGPGRERLADLAAEIERLTGEIERLTGRIEVAEHQAKQALKESRAARSAASTAIAVPSAPEPPPAVPDEEPGEAGSEEIGAYRSAYAAWRNEDHKACIDRFRGFLQTYPNSPYADDGAYWMADCYFRNGDYKTAVLRFDDVVTRYPNGNKAADALYRQGEALLRLGPNFGKAAGKAFERVLKEYPDSARVPEAKRQLELLRPS